MEYELRRSAWGSWQVRATKSGTVFFETMNRIKAEGVLEYLRQKGCNHV